MSGTAGGPGPVVLVHGAFRGGWAWRPVRDRLQALGHDVHTPSLTGMGDRSHLRDRPVGLDTWVQDVVALVEADDLIGVTLVGHSQGGLVVRAAAPRLVRRLAVLGYLDAPVPWRGERGVDLNPGGPPSEDQLPPRDTWIPSTPVDPAGLAGSAVPADRLAAWVNERLCPTPLGPSLDPVDSDDPPVRAGVAFCADTPEPYPCWTTRHRMDAAGEAYTVLDAGHDAPLTHPDLVAGWVTGLR